MQIQGRKSQGIYQIVGQPILPGFQSASVAALDRSQESDDVDNNSPGPGGTTRSSCYSVMKRWHARLGHANTESIKNLIRSDAVTGVSIRPNTSRRGDCDSCVKGKQARETLRTNHSRSQEPGAVIHTDLCGPMSVATITCHSLMNTQDTLPFSQSCAKAMYWTSSSSFTRGWNVSSNAL